MAQPTSRKRKADSSPARSGNDVDPSAGSAPESKPNNTKGKAKAKAKGKSKEAIELKETEKKGKSIVVLLRKAAQIIDRITGEIDKFPSEWVWAKPLLQDFGKIQCQLKAALNPDQGDDLTEFANELKLAAISPTASKEMKRQFGMRYLPMLTLFVDRTEAIAHQTLE